MDIQITKFPDSGFAAFKISVPAVKSKVSAWFDKDGKVVDAEFSSNGRAFPVKRGGPVWRELESVGRIHKGI